MLPQMRFREAVSVVDVTMTIVFTGSHSQFTIAHSAMQSDLPTFPGPAIPRYCQRHACAIIVSAHG